MTVSLWASSSSVDTDFTAKLVDVHPNGYAQNLLDGIIRARYRESGTHPTLLKPGQIYKYAIHVWPTSNLFKAGHAIRLEISSSNFPALRSESQYRRANGSSYPQRGGSKHSPLRRGSRVTRSAADHPELR